MNEQLETNYQYSDFYSEVVPHLNPLKNFALKMTHDNDESNDLVQSTLLKAFRFFDMYKKGTNTKAWLFKIMKNSFINDYRKMKREPVKVNYEDIENFYETIKSDEVKSRHYNNDDFNNILDDEITYALSALPDESRTIVFLCDIEGYSYEEIADFIGCPVGTVRSRLHRTRKILYAMLYQYAQKNGYVK
ncbi:MAG: sigma-70 family RNA polymerase sigma factor [Ignavibacteriales bacterium]|nr:sigma-70 family RNA polymerase sigma factor [Ignavibacteriales bacterium]